MSFRDFLVALWPFKPSAEKQIKILLQQINTALADLKIRIAESLANESALQKKILQSKGSTNEGIQFCMLESSLTAEQQVTLSLKEVYFELSNKKRNIEHVYEQTIARKRKASTHEMLASIYKDFGSDIKLNHYLEKFCSESIKIEYTAESNLRIERLLNKTDQ